MEAVKKFIAQKTVGWYISAAALVLGLVTLIIYGARGGNSYSPISGAAITLMIFGLLTNAAALVKDFRLGSFVPYIFWLIAFGVLFNSEMLFVSNVLSNIDNNVFDSAFIAFIVFFIMTFVCGITAAVMRLDKKK